ncbi:glycosyltransferase [Bosea sp. BK604]|uniref:glycosyltransferase n=1 Tax=Bosea sp. BK604 TaxID=2512180 RepID=UPI00104EA0C0|nr:glycosyltransferase [Bosea sp. BK604]TCR70001.1 undecaprenyl-phosphate 4-deoxy-4-formamido-L-arabinose transferase [Bosea sp. BK604]
MSSNPSSSASSDRWTGAAAPGGVGISLVIPAYNEESGIEALVREAHAVLAGIDDRFEIIVVNDGSRDNTARELSKLAEEFPELRPISLRINSGQHVATFIGLREARGDFVFLADADLKAALPSLVLLHAAAQADERLDIVSGIRSNRSKTMYRSLGSNAVSFIVNRLTGAGLRDPASPLRLYRRHVVETIVEADILAQNLPILTALLGLHVQEIELDIPDSGRRSRYTLAALVHILLLALLNFSGGTRTILTLIGLGSLSLMLGGLGLVGMTIDGIVRQQALGTNLLLLFVLLTVVGLQFCLMGVIAYKLERINTNLRFRQLVYGARYDRRG